MSTPQNSPARLPVPEAFNHTGLRWHRISNRMRRSDAMFEAGFEAHMCFRLLIEAAAEVMKDGVLSRASAMRELRDAPSGAQANLDKLVEVGVIAIDGDTVTIISFWKYQNSTAELTGDRASAAERQASSRATRAAKAKAAASSSKASKASSSASADAGVDTDADGLCEFLADATATATRGQRPEVTPEWRAGMHTVLERAGRDSALVREVIGATFKANDFHQGRVRSAGPAHLVNCWTELAGLATKQAGDAAMAVTGAAGYDNVRPISASVAQ